MWHLASDFHYLGHISCIAMPISSIYSLGWGAISTPNPADQSPEPAGSSTQTGVTCTPYPYNHTTQVRTTHVWFKHFLSTFILINNTIAFPLMSLQVECSAIATRIAKQKYITLMIRIDDHILCEDITLSSMIYGQQILLHVGSADN